MTIEANRNNIEELKKNHKKLAENFIGSCALEAAMKGCTKVLIAKQSRRFNRVDGGMFTQDLLLNEKEKAITLSDDSYLTENDLAEVISERKDLKLKKDYDGVIGERYFIFFDEDSKLYEIAQDYKKNQLVSEYNESKFMKILQKAINYGRNYAYFCDSFSEEELIMWAKQKGFEYEDLSYNSNTYLAKVTFPSLRKKADEKAMSRIHFIEYHLRNVIRKGIDNNTCFPTIGKVTKEIIIDGVYDRFYVGQNGFVKLLNDTYLSYDDIKAWACDKDIEIDLEVNNYGLFHKLNLEKSEAYRKQIVKSAKARFENTCNRVFKSGFDVVLFEIPKKEKLQNELLIQFIKQNDLNYETILCDDKLLYKVSF